MRLEVTISCQFTLWCTGLMLLKYTGVGDFIGKVKFNEPENGIDVWAWPLKQRRPPTYDWIRMTLESWMLISVLNLNNGFHLILYQSCAFSCWQYLWMCPFCKFQQLARSSAQAKGAWRGWGDSWSRAGDCDCGSWPGEAAPGAAADARWSARTTSNSPPRTTRTSITANTSIIATSWLCLQDKDFPASDSVPAHWSHHYFRTIYDQGPPWPRTGQVLIQSGCPLKIG